MSQLLQTIQLRDFSSGIIQKIDDRLVAKNCINFALNLRFDEIIGRATLRTGTALVGAQISASKSILGLFQFILSSGTKYLLTVLNGASTSEIYYLNTGTWTASGTTMTKDVKTRFITYLDTVMAIDGTLAKSSINGSIWFTTGGNLDIANCPKGKYATVWRDQVYVAGVSATPDRLFYSSIPTGGAISWTVGNGYIDIEPYRGQGSITALGKVPGYLLIFKERALKRWNGSSTFPDDLTNIGTPSHESVVFGKTTTFYFSSSFKESVGFYETNGETTRLISRPIQGIVDAISSSNYSSVSGFSNGTIAMWEIGNITYDGNSYSNVVVMYHISNQCWSVLSFPTTFNMFSQYIDGNDLKIVAGNTNGEIIEIFTGLNDNITGSANISINYALQWHPIDLGARGNQKEISSILPYMKNGCDASVFCRIDEKDDFRSVGVVKDDFESELSKILKGHLFEIKITGSKVGGNLQIIGADVLTPEIEESIKK